MTEYYIGLIIGSYDTTNNATIEYYLWDEVYPDSKKAKLRAKHVDNEVYSVRLYMCPGRRWASCSRTGRS